MSDSLDIIRSQIFADADMQHRLAAIEDRPAFVAAVLDVARSSGIALDAEMVDRALVPDPLGLRRFDPVTATTISNDWPCIGWLPSAIVQSSGTPLVEWLHFGGARFDAPFFEDAVRRARRRPLNRLLQWHTPLARLADTAPALTPPDGLVFHMSRCGSTLVAQTIAAIAGTRVISEAAPIDGVVQFARSHPDLADSARADLLRAMVGALGRGGNPEGAYVVKLDSWHTLALPLFNAAFPDVPWIFLYRDPVEVMVSQMRARGLQTVPGAIGDPYGIAPGLSVEAHVGRVLARIADAVLDHDRSNRLLIPYDDLPDAIAARIVPHFGITLTADDRVAMAAVATRDAKRPGTPFLADGAGKRAEASQAVVAAVITHLASTHRRLAAAARAQFGEHP
ncbi:hypothetical protein [Sphingomonas faeni]|uniref:hypothetical protein n=1 Tax=Sphingomonas faeni TaxID=185950 RepID=UPI00334B10DA